MGDGMTGMARQDNRPPLYAVMTTMMAKVYTIKNMRILFGHFRSSPSGKANNSKMSKSKEGIILFRTWMKAMQNESTASKQSHTGESRG